MQKLKEEIKQKIMEVGKLKFQKEGYSNTSMKDIATDAGISTGNIYRYFLTKKHLLNEILKEIEKEVEELFKQIPSDYGKINLDEAFNLLIESTVKIAETKADTLKVLFNSEQETQFIEFKEKILDMLIKKFKTIAGSINNKNMDYIVCEAIARAQFEGFTHIVKSNINNIEALKKNLRVYEKLMIENIGRRIEEVVKE